MYPTELVQMIEKTLTFEEIFLKANSEIKRIWNQGLYEIDL